MNKFAYIVLAVIVGVLIGVFVVPLISDKEALKEETVAVKENAKKILYYQAPMDPTYIRNEPGKSPMGMDLIPVYEGENDDTAGTVSIDPVTIQTIGVKTAVIERTTLEKTIRTIGRIDYDEKRVTKVHSKVDGWIEKLYVDFTGKKVKEDEILLEIYSPMLVSAEEEYLLALKNKDKIKTIGDGSLAELSKERLKLWGVPPHQIKELEETGKIMRTLHIHSPASGIVIEKPVTEGMYVKPATSLYTIADISSVWVYVDIYEYEIPLVKVGQSVEMILEAYPGEVFTGEVTFIYPFMEAESRTNKVRLEFKNPTGKLKPDMYASVTIASVIGRNLLAVPTEAVIRSGQRNVVIIDKGDGKFSAVEVILGSEAEGYFEVSSGLTEGARVVTSAQFLIDSESKLKEAIGKILEEGKPADVKSGETMDHTMHDMDNMEEETMDHSNH